MYRFTRALFGLTSSPFLHSTKHSWEDRYPELVKELRECLYVDDLMTCGVTVKETEEKKAMAMEVFEDATFSIHKWHSNAKELQGESESSPESEDEVSYAKQQLGGGEPIGGKLLGLPWNRERDTFGIIFKVDDCTTKRDVLSLIARVYDTLGLVLPTMLTAKLLYRVICHSKISWDAQLPEPLLKRWKDWRSLLTEEFTVP